MTQRSLRPWLNASPQPKSQEIFGTLLIFPVGQLSDQLAKEYARSPRAMRAVRGQSDK